MNKSSLVLEAIFQNLIALPLFGAFLLMVLGLLREGTVIIPFVFGSIFLCVGQFASAIYRRHDSKSRKIYFLVGCVVLSVILLGILLALVGEIGFTILLLTYPCCLILSLVYWVHTCIDALRPTTYWQPNEPSLEDNLLE